MTVPPEITRKVRQLDHDVQAIYEMLARLEATQQRHGNRLAEIAEVQTEQGTTLGEHTRTLDEHTRTLDEHTRKLDEQGRKLDEQGRKLDEQGRKLDEILEILRRR